MHKIPNMPPKFFSISAVSVGLFLISDLDATEQNALGNWLMLVAQALCTNAYYVELVQERRSKSNNNGLSEEETINMLKNMVNALNKEINEIKKSL